MGSYIGAEIDGVDVTQCSDEQFAELKQAFIDYGIIAIREQNLTPEQHVEFAQRWGEININRFFKPSDQHPLIAEVRKEPHQKMNIGAVWHTDHSYDLAPALGLSLIHI